MEELVTKQDFTDNQIIDILESDGRASNAKIAREVGVSEGTIRRRLRRLVDEDVIKIKAVPDLSKMGFPTTALIGLQTAPGELDTVADAITNMEDVHYVAITTGAFDVFACVAKPSTEELGVFLRTKIGTIPGVTRTETFVNLSIKKRTYGLVL